jgi:hypothetical protein
VVDEVKHMLLQKCYTWMLLRGHGVVPALKEVIKPKPVNLCET